MNAAKRKKTRAVRRTLCKAAGLALRHARVRAARRAVAERLAALDIEAREHQVWR